MSEKINDGGDAFPVGFGDGTGEKGMTMRQYYKAAALQGILSRPGMSLKYDNDEIKGWVKYYAATMIAEDAAHARGEK